MQKLELDLPKRTHIAIMRKSWGLTQKILTGEKTIESRWYKNKYKPWDRIDRGDVIYFKDSGEPVAVKARVAEVRQFANLDPRKVREILFKYAKADGLGIDESQIELFYKLFKDKRYCIVVLLKNVEAVEPFEIDKTGFGAMASWLIVDDIGAIKRRMS